MPRPINEATWCPQCGPRVHVDDDGCCAMCGCDAVGHGATFACVLLRERDQNRGSARRALAWALAWVAFAVAIALLLLPAVAQARWSPQAEARIRRDRSAILAASAATGVPAELLAAVAGHETQARLIPSTARDAHGRPLDWGPGQVRWRTWGRLLRDAGIAQRPEDLLKAGPGYMAAAWVLARKRARYRPRSRALWLCLYGVGLKARGFKRDCAYSRQVERNIKRARWALRGRG